jgi:GMP synthase (glutamine-hydrolysing)
MLLIIDCGSQKTQFIEELVDLHLDYKTISILEVSPEEIEKYTGVIISGAPIQITEVDMQLYLDKVAWIKTATIPVLGICFGHQLIGLLFGAYGSKMREDRDWQEIEVLANHALFERMPIVFEMMEDHCECISLPPNFELIATSDACVNEAMVHPAKSIMGVQFHPEVSGNFGAILIENFIKLCETKN